MEADVKTIQDLPIEILQTIFSYGISYDFLSFRQVCTRWNEGIGSLIDSQQKIILKINGKRIYDRVNESMLSSECRTPFQGIRFKHLGRFGSGTYFYQPQRIVTFPPNVLSPLKRLEFHYSMSNHTNLFQIIAGCPNLQHLKVNCPTEHRKMKVDTDPGNYGPILAQLQSVSLTAAGGTRNKRRLYYYMNDERSPLVAIHSILPKFVEHCKSLKSFDLDITKLSPDYASHHDFKRYDPITIPGALKRIIQNNWVTLTSLNVKVVGLTELQEIGQILATGNVDLGNIMNLVTLSLGLRTDLKPKLEEWDSNAFLENLRLFIETQEGLRNLYFPLIKNDMNFRTLEKFYKTLGAQKYLSTLTIEAFCEVNLNYLNLCGPSLKTLTVNFYDNEGDHFFTPFNGEVEAIIQELEIRLKVVDNVRAEDDALISTLQLFPHLSHLTLDTSISNELLQDVIRHCAELKYLDVLNIREVTDFGVTGIDDSFSRSEEVRENGLVRDYDVESGRVPGGVSLTNLRNLEILNLGSPLQLTDFGIRHGFEFPKLKRIRLHEAQRITDQGLMILAFQNPNLTHAEIDTDVPRGHACLAGPRGFTHFGIDTFLRLLPHMFQQNARIRGYGVMFTKLRGPLMYDDADVEDPGYNPPLLAMALDPSSDSDN